MSGPSDREALLWAVLANPEDDAPRLVYADWLEDNGEEADADRARFIRMQCEAARAEADEAVDWVAGIPEGIRNVLDWEPIAPAVGRRLALEPEVEKLLRRRKKEFLAGLPLGGGVAIYHRRGFAERCVARTAKAFLKRAEAAFRAAPVTSLTISHPDPREMADLARSGHLRKITELTFFAEEDEHVVPILASLGASADVAGVRTLEVFSHSSQARLDWAVVAQVLASGREWGALRRLAFEFRGDCSRDAIERLARAPHLRGLADLDLAGGRFEQGPDLGPGRLPRSAAPSRGCGAWPCSAAPSRTTRPTPWPGPPGCARCAP
jgi:uncharacterized protein (TIGR02996 family)